MSRGIIIADLHLDSFPNRTPSKDFRLNQCLLIMDNIIREARNYGALDFVIVAGDIVEKPNRDSVTHHIIKKCMGKLAESFSEAYYILGNHDSQAHSKGSESREMDYQMAYLPLYMPDKFKYMDREVIIKDGVTIGFRNHSFADTLNLDFITSPVDILIGHSSQHYDPNTEPLYQVQSYDEDKIKGNAFWGHIHQSGVLGKNVSIGVPQRCHTKDDIPQMVLLELSQGSYRWKHVETDPGKTQMDIIADTAIDVDYYDEATNIYHVARRQKGDIARKVNQVKTTESYEVILSNYVKNSGLQGIYEYVKGNTNLSDSDKLDLNFQITSLLIHNWRSIADLKMEFNPGDKVLVSGVNGSGKSSIFSAILYALSGKISGSSIKEDILHGETDMWVDLNLFYKGKEYHIHRGTDDLYVLENGVRLEMGNKNESKKKILELFPFSDAMDYMYYNDNNCRVLAGEDGAGNTKRLTNLYRLIGLTEIEALHNSAFLLKRDAEAEWKEKLSYIDGRFGSLGVEKEGLIKYAQMYGPESIIDYSIKLMEDGLEEVKTQVQEYQRATQERQKYQEQLNAITREESVLEGYKLTLSSSYRDDESYKTLINNASVELEKVREQLKSLNEVRVKFITLQTELTRMNRDLNLIREEAGNLKVEEAQICPSQGIVCPVVTEEMRIQDYNRKMEALKVKYGEELQVYNQKLAEYQGLQYDEQKINQVSSEESRLTTEIMRLEGEIRAKSEITWKIQQQQTLLDNLKASLNPNISAEIPILPDGIMDQMTKYGAQLTDLNDYKRLSETVRSKEAEADVMMKECDALEKTVKDLSAFLEITKSSGPVYRDILESVMKAFSNKEYEYTISMKRSGKGSSLSINAYKLGGTRGHKTPYHSASSGEKTLIDLNFLVSFINLASPGLLILDEALKSLSAENHDEAVELVKGLEGTGLVFLVSHMENLAPLFSNRVMCKKSEDGVSEYIID